MAIDPNNTVGTDIGTPPQNPVYQQDPFEEQQFQQAIVQEGTGRAYKQSGLGFGVKPRRYQIDPLAQTPTEERRRRYYGDEDTRELAAELAPESLARYDEENPPPPPPAEEPTRLEGYQETGELTPENVPDVYSLTADELPQYGIDINAPNVGTPPPAASPGQEIVSGWNDADGDGYDDDGHAMGAHGPVNVRTRQGESSIAEALAYADPLSPVTSVDGTWQDHLRGGIDRAGDLVEGYAQPRTRDIAGGQDTVTTSPGGAVSLALPGGLGAVAAIGGAISARNLDNIHSEYGNYQGDTGMGYIPRDQLDAGTPLAISEGFIPGTSVVSGNTDLAIRNNPALDVNGDGQLNAIELRDAIAAREQVEQERARQAELDRIAEQDRQLAEAARRAEEEAARQRAEELSRQQRAAEEAARREAQRREEQARAQEQARVQEAARRAEAQRRANETGREQSYGSGSAVTDSHGRAVRSGSDNSIVTSGRSTVQPQRDSGGGGGGGGGDSCFAADTKFLMANGDWKNVQDIKVGDEMAEGGRVYGILQGDGTLCDWYCYDDVYVTGSHFVYEDIWTPVAKSHGAVLVWGGFDTWYCVLNENHRMVSEGYYLFTDFDAVDSVNEELEERLNG